MGHVPKYGKGKQKTNRKEHSQIALPERPDKSLRTRQGSKFSGTATRTGQRLSRCGSSKEHRCILPAPATERPRTSESAPVRGSNGGVRCARKSDPMNDNATTLSASLWQRAVPTDEEAPRREPMIGSTAIPRVEYGGESHCASPTTSVAFTLQKQYNRPPTMKRSGQLGCRASESARQPPRLKGLTRDPYLRQVLGCLTRGPTGGPPAGCQLAALVSA